MINYPLMQSNISKEDVQCAIDFLQKSDRFTQGENVREFEREWSEWLGVKHSIFVNSGASANFITMAVLKECYGPSEIIVPTLTWSSDIASLLQCGHKPVFVDCSLKNLAMDEDGILSAITPATRAVFLTHVLGFNGLSDRLLDELKSRNILLIEDVCESTGATFKDKKLGTFGAISNFSFYYAHHMSTIEGGMICTNDDKLYRLIRMFRSHGMLRECGDTGYIKEVTDEFSDLNPEFIFMIPSFNFRSTEINAVIGRNQLKRLDAQNIERSENLKLFLDNLNSELYYTDFDCVGNSNYALTVIQNNADETHFKHISQALSKENVEFRRGTAGGGNMVRQPFVKKYVPGLYPDTFKNTDHIHFYGMYIGNYPSLEKEKILQVCDILNKA